MKLHEKSHLDHGLSERAIAWLLERYADRTGFFIDTTELPPECGELTCALYGPLCGDPEVSDDEVIHGVRGTRTWESRLVERHARATRTITVIAGPIGDVPCALYTSYGGPCAPQEPGDPGCRDVSASERFWGEHALATLEYDPEFRR